MGRRVGLDLAAGRGRGAARAGEPAAGSAEAAARVGRCAAKRVAALAQCRQEKALLIIAKLDRLGRNVAFIANLMESRVDFKAVDNPYANKLMVHLLAAFAEHEREQISVRTRDALQAAKRRGVQLGKHGRDIESKRNAKAAVEFAESMKPLIESLRAEGFGTVRAIRDELNRRQVPTYRGQGQQWHLQSVHSLLKRL